MIDLRALIDDILEHGESRYDPVYAREYYLRTRELNGRRSSSELKTESQKIGWNYVKSKVNEEKKAALGSAREGNKAEIAQLRSNAEKRGEEIREKLRIIMENITTQAKETREDISEDVLAKIDKLPPIPKGISGPRAAALQAERRKQIERIRGDAATDRAKLSGDTKTVRGQERDLSARNRETVRNQLVSSIETARSKYNTLKETIKAKYESELDAEYENIRNTVR